MFRELNFRTKSCKLIDELDYRIEMDAFATKERHKTHFLPPGDIQFHG
jgi:hypothetical protein